MKEKYCKSCLPIIFYINKVKTLKKKKISNSCEKYAAKTKILYSTRYTPILKSIKTMTLIFLIS